MATYRVEMPTCGVELYEVEADDAEDALRIVQGGEGYLLVSEASFDYEVEPVATLVEEED